MNLQKTKGLVENLHVVRTKQSILYGPQMKEASGISAIVFGLAGMAGAAVQTAMNADGGADDVDVYSFEIDGVKYAGVTRGISVKNGDEVELVYEVRPQGNEALAIRRPETRSIWLYPYMSRGSSAGVARCIRLWLLASFGLAVGSWALMSIPFLLNGRPLSLLLTLGLGCLGISLLALTIGVSWILPRLFRFSRAADQVFSAFGYARPKWVDLQKTTKAYLKTNKIPWSLKNMFELWY